jgi:heat shock protein HtpX
MTIPTTQLSTRFRTWALVAGLTALLVAVGALLGGVFLWLFVVFAAGINVVGYFYSDRIALRAAHAQPLSESDAPAVYESVRVLAARARIPMPRLFVMPGEQANAFATGRDPQHAAVVVTEGLLLSLPHVQLTGVLAHELSHIKNHDILVSSLAATIAGTISAITSILQLSFLFGGDGEDNPLGLLGSLAAMILAPIGATLLQLGVSRQREYLADATAARLMGEAAPLADALQQIEQAHAPALQVSPATAPMYIVNPLAAGQLTSLFSTHPPLGERIRRLREYDRLASLSTTQSAGRRPRARLVTR